MSPIISSFPRISGVDSQVRYTPPKLGEHTQAVLQEFGYTETEITQFQAEGAL